MNANPPRRGLGRGLGSLIPTAPQAARQAQSEPTGSSADMTRCGVAIDQLWPNGS